jgi:ABC-type lipoprotein release transport system permease subunit
MVLIEPKNFYVVYTNITCANGVAFRRREKGIKMIAKIALMIVAISVAVVMAVSCMMPCIMVDANQTKTSNCSNLRNNNGEKEMEKEGRKGKNFFEGESVGN